MMNFLQGMVRRTRGRDTNQNNVIDAGEQSELKTLDALGITSINLTGDANANWLGGGAGADVILNMQVLNNHSRRIRA